MAVVGCSVGLNDIVGLSDGLDEGRDDDCIVGLVDGAWED